MIKIKLSWQPAQVLKIKETNKTTLLEVATTFSKEEILKYCNGGEIFGVLKLFDTRRITPEQRGKIFATIRNIADYFGDPVELTRDNLTSSFCAETGQEYFSLSDCSLETAKELINFIIEYVIEHDIPLTGLAVDRTDDIDRYLYYSIKHSKCCCCGRKAIVYTLGDKTKICMCDIHHDIAKNKGLNELEKAWKVYPIKYLG